MKIQIDIDKNILEPEVVIRCSEVDDEVLTIESLLNKMPSEYEPLVYYKKEQEYYFSVIDILFFEADTQGVAAHTINDVFLVKERLYRLEEKLPSYFVRVSKSTIVNSRKIYSILRNVTSSSKIEFYNTHKKIYVSRNYYKQLKKKLMERRS